MDAVFGPVVALLGIAWIGFMLTAMFSILRLAPKGQKLRAYNQLSMWKFAEIRADLGPPAEPHLATMRRGAYAFLIVIGIVILVAIGSIVVTSMNRGAA